MYLTTEEANFYGRLGIREGAPKTLPRMLNSGLLRMICGVVGVPTLETPYKMLTLVSFVTRGFVCILSPLFAFA